MFHGSGLKVCRERGVWFETLKSCMVTGASGCEGGCGGGGDEAKPEKQNKAKGWAAGWQPYRGAHGVAHAEVEAALFVHGVVQARQVGQRGPVVVKGVVAEAVVGAAAANNREEAV